MKYLINESMAKKMAFEGIKDVFIELDLERKEFDSFIVYSTIDEADFGYDNVVIEYDYEDGRLYVEPRYFENMLSLFGYNTIDEQKEIFEGWFYSWEGIKPQYVEF